MTQLSTHVTRIRHSLAVSPLAFEYLSSITLVVTYVVMLLGAYTSALGAGLSCPDWPMCYETWIPFLQPEIIANSSYSALQIFAEGAHRGLAMAAGVLILVTTIEAWIVYRDSPLVMWSATIALILLPVQVLLGGLTVTENLKPIIVTTHLGIATFILLCLLTTVLTSWLVSQRAGEPTQL